MGLFATDMDFDFLKGSQVAFIAQLIEKGVYYIGVSDKFKHKESFSRQNTITQHTIESGANIDDHMIDGQLIVNQTFTVSVLSRSRLAGAAILTPIAFSLNHLSRTKEFVTVITFAGVHKNMVIEKVECDNSDEACNFLTCNLTFREILQGNIENSLVSSTSIFDKTVKARDEIFNKSRKIPTTQNHLMATFS